MPSPQLDERRPPMTPQLAMRVAVLGGFAFALFAIVFFRLWFLQVLSGDEYIVEARENRVRKERIEAPRGDIVDRTGATLVRTRKSPTVVVNPEELPRPGAPRHELYARLGKVLDMPARKVQAKVLEERKKLPYADVRLKTDVGSAVKNYIRERAEQFPGVDVPDIYLRAYPHDTLAAQLFGSTREISPEELKQPKYSDLEAGARIGAGGVEQTYDQFLRGTDGYRRYTIDALGNRKDVGPRGPSIKQPRQGRQLRMSIDLGLQRTASEAMQQAAETASANGNSGAKAGAFVAMNPKNGEVYALGSSPSFDANEFAKPLSNKRYKQIENRPGKPLYNRALQGSYPVGSTFKPFTAIAGLKSGAITPETIFNDTGTFRIGEGEGEVVKQNAGGEVYGAVNLVEALKVSVDTYFYRLGEQLYDLPGHKRPIQAWARKFGFGRPTGIDIPNTATGFVPDAKTVGENYRRYVRCVRKYDLAERTTAALNKCGGWERAFQGGDNVDLAVGQGYFLASPLQLATAYAALFNGGKVLRPRVGLAVEDHNGGEVQKIRPAPARRIDISESTLAPIREGLRKAAMEEGGTSYDVFNGFKHTVYGKTGTAEHLGRPDQSWYAAVVLEPRPIVVVVTIENGGFGAETAAPAARVILSRWLGQSGKWQPGSSRDG